jgi:hypothetical protein
VEWASLASALVQPTTGIKGNYSGFGLAMAYNQIKLALLNLKHQKYTVA